IHGGAGLSTTAALLPQVLELVAERDRSPQAGSRRPQPTAPAPGGGDCRLGAMDLSLRRSTPTTWIGNVPLGSGHPVAVQSMTNTDTADAAGTAQQVAELARAGSEIVRVTVNNDAAAQAVPEIRQRLDDMELSVPLVGDFHYNGHKLLVQFPEAARTLDKYR